LSSTAFGLLVLSRPLRFSIVRTLLGVALMGLAVAAPPLLVPLFSPDGLIEPETQTALATLRLGLLVAGAGLVLAQPIAVALARFAILVKAGSSNSETRAFLLFALLVPASALVILAEPERSDRFWWLWPLVVVFLATLVFHVVGLATVRRRIAAAGLAALLVGLSWAHPPAIARLQSWSAYGWSGVDPDEVRAIDYVAARVAPLRQPKIGYHVRFFHGITTLSAVDARFKVGAPLDVVLEQKHRIVNASRCAEGFDPGDDYRLVDDPSRPSLLGDYRIVASPGAGFRLVRSFGSTRVFERVGLTGQ
jgi:hypothetical protein